ncbi:MAG: hypothetical protein GY771_00375, partial [bacterium]|nr:hypothetical protein [bacterium]
MTTGASDYVPANLLGTLYAPVMVSGTPAVVELRAAWPTLSVECKEMVREFHGWGRGESWGNTTWRPTTWGNTSYAGRERFKYGSPGGDFWVWWITDPFVVGADPVQIDPDDYDHPDNPYNQDEPIPIPDSAYFYDKYYQLALDTYTDHGWYDFSDTDYGEWFPLRDYYADYDDETEGDQPFPGGDYDYGGDDRWDVYIGFVGENTGGVTFLDNAFPLTPWNVFSAYCAMPRNVYVDRPDAPFNDPETCFHEYMHVTQFMYDALEVSPTPQTRWYLEATAMWAEMLRWPEPITYGYLRDSLGRWTSYLGGSSVTLGGGADLQPYSENIINFFFEDWSSRDWVAPDWIAPPTDPGYTGDPYTINNGIVREMWRSTAGPGDPFFTEDATTNRTTYEAFDYVIQTHNPGARYMTDRNYPAWESAYNTFAGWNWFLGTQDDGNHYRYGSFCTADHAQIILPFMTGGYPIDPHYYAPETRLMNFYGHAYLDFADLNTDPVVGSWDAAVCGFYGDPLADADTKYWNGGAYFTSNGGGSWGNAGGTQGQLEPSFDVDNYSLIRVDNPSQFNNIAYMMTNTAEIGTDLNYYVFFEEAEESVPAVANVSVVRPQMNPDYLEVIVGTNEDLFGVPKITHDMDYNSADDEYGYTIMNGNGSNNRSFAGTYVMPIGASGSGTLDYEMSDLNGNMTTGQLSLDLGYITGTGGVVGDDPAFIRVPSGAVTKPVHVSIVPLDGFIESPGENNTTLKNGVTSLNAGDRANSLGETEVFGTAYDFGPTWARLNDDVYVTLNYGDSNVVREDYLSV